jgi:parallel beta-helix repeat protein
MSTPQCSDIRGNKFDRCTISIYAANCNYTVIAGNVISGTTGPAEPAPIQSMTWSSSGGGVTTVNTAAAHNISNGSTIQLVDTNPPQFVPTPNVISPPNPPASGNGFVTVTVDSPTRFHYSGPSSSPPNGFVSGSWNWPIQYGMLVPGSSNCTFAANVISAVSLAVGFGIDSDIGGWNNVVMAMGPPRGWTAPHAGTSGSYKPHVGWSFLACVPGAVGDNPLRFIHVADLIAETYVTRPYNSFNVVDAQMQNTFGQPVVGGGASCYKVRHDGANWVRVG